MQSTSKVAAMAGALALGGMFGIGSEATFAQATDDLASSTLPLIPPTPSPYQPASVAPARTVSSTSVGTNGTTARTSAPSLASRRPAPSLANRAVTGNGIAATPGGAPASSYPFPRSGSVANDPAASDTARYSSADAYRTSFTSTAGANGAPTAASASNTADPSSGMAGGGRANPYQTATDQPGAAPGYNATVPSNDPGYPPTPNPAIGATGAGPNGPNNEYWSSSSPPPPQRKPSRLRRLFSFLDYRNREEADTETSASSYRDPSTGLNTPLAKPWLQHYNQQSYQPDK